MRNMPISQLYPGLILGEDIYIPGTNKLLLPINFVLTDKSIARLEFYAIYSVKIKDADSDAPAPEPEEAYFSERVRNSAEFAEFSKKYNKNIDLFKRSLINMIGANKPLSIDILLADTLSLLHSGNSKVNLFDILTNLRNYDDATYAHNINVALICNIFAGWLHLSEEDTRIATLCGLLHDIGKIMVPEVILNKKGALSPEEYSIAKTHAAKGYQKLRDLGIDLRICNAALMHHERYDGSGYPLGLEGEQISPFACMVSIADVYDAMTSARPYREPLCPFHVISLFESDGYQKYSPQYLMTFLENIANSYLLNTVRLSDGREGTLVFVNRTKFSCPTIKVGNEYIDLFKETNLSIERVL